MSDDAALLRRYLDGSDEAFAELVRLHLGAVYGTALRLVAGDAHLASDVSQKVFTSLARKASSLAERPTIIGWLYLSAQYEAAKAVRSEQRWRNREQKAQAMQEIENQGAPEPDWTALRPVLDSAMRDLKETDRDALLLRFFQARTLSEVGEALGLSENAARMRVDRALDKLRGLLARRGIKSTATALGTVLTGQIVPAAPATLATTVTATALAGAGTAAGATTLFMGLTKLQAGLAAALAVAGGSALWSERQTAESLRAENASLAAQTAEIASLKIENARLEAQAQQIAVWRSEAAAFSALREESARLRQEANKVLNAQNSPPGPRRSTPSATTADGQKIYRLSELDKRPTPKKQIQPAYPFEMKAAGVTGRVIISLVVSPDGTTRDLQVEQATNDSFATTALDAVKQWEFDPATKDGVAVNTRVSIPFTYSLENRSSGEWF